LIVRTLEDTPTGATHSSTRDLAPKAGISPSLVGRIWRTFGLKPWLTDTFKLSEDPQFVDKVRDVVGLSSWPNLVQRWFAELTNKMLKRSAHKSIAALTADLNAWIAAWNDDPKPFVWHKTADQILDSLKKYLTNL
jgi:hypothetical protein